VKCRHGVTGRCAQCEGQSLRGELLIEVARLVVQLGDSAGLDTSRVEAVLKELRR